jgi:predicted extracellular nuclease
MERIRSRATRWLALTLLLASTSAAAECITLGQLWGPYSQSFDSLVVNGTSSQLPPGWTISEGAAGDGLIAANDGTATTPGVYSYATGTNSNRALGSLANASIAPVLGACFHNLTGTTITSLSIDYGAQQWRLGAPDRIDRLDFQISTNATGLLDGSWLDVNALDLKTVSTGTAGPREGTVAPNYVERLSPVSVNIPPDATFWIRWKDYNVPGDDDGLGIDWFSLTPWGSNPPRLSLSGVNVLEGNGGTTAAHFVARLDRPAAAGGVHFIASTADFSADAGTDYVPVTLNGYIAAGKTATVLTVNLIGDTDWEMDEQFQLQLGNATGAIITGWYAMGTIRNDDPKIFEVHDIQAHRYFGSPVHVRGIVTARSANGFFMQTPDADVDGTGQGSEGLFVQTGTAPPSTASPGNLVIAAGAVQEFVPPNDPGSPSRTQLGGTPTVSVISTGNALPAPILLPLISFNGSFDQLERYEGMRVAVGDLQVTGPSGGTVNEANATATSNGLFHAVQVGNPRPHREAGIQAPDPAQSPLPVWDTNPELIGVDTDALGGAKLDLSTGSIVRGLSGVLDYAKRRYTILRDRDNVVTVEPHPPTHAARLPASSEFTVASYSLGRFFDAGDDASKQDVVLTPTALAGRLNKASLGIRNYLHLPDILAVQEIENLATLRLLATKINDDEAAAGRPDPGYVAYLVEGNDATGLDIGLLVKTVKVDGVQPRVEVLSVQQLGKTATWVDPGLARPTLLNDRPPLLLDARVHLAGPGVFPITVVVVDQRARDGIDSQATSGATTLGDRVRQKRLRQSEFIAGKVQAMQAEDSARHIVVLGNFNAFELNDGYVDVMDVVSGTQYYDQTTLVAGDGATLVSPSLYVLPTYGAMTTYPYTMVEDGNMQSLDHVMTNSALASAANQGIDFAHINADLPETRRNSFATPSRLSAHDPVIAYFSIAKFANLAVTARANTSAVHAGQSMGFTATVTNLGPDEAPYTGIGFAFDAVLPDLKIVASPDWSCGGVEVANGATSASCVAVNFGNGANSTFALSATAPSASAGNTIKLAALATSSSTDNTPANNEAMAAISVSP